MAGALRRVPMFSLVKIFHGEFETPQYTWEVRKKMTEQFHGVTPVFKIFISESEEEANQVYQDAVRKWKFDNPPTPIETVVCKTTF